MKTLIRVMTLIAWGLWLLGLSVPVGAEGTGQVDLITVKGAITPIVASYMERSITTAEGDGAVCLIVQLDTPGGSVQVTEGIVQRMLSARVPIVVYVYPQGGKAASAGTFITVAAHLAAMAPDTRIGAAHPVGLGEEISDTSMEKAVNDLVAFIRELAKRRGEEAMDWVEKAVRESASIGPDEALDLGVIDMVAPDLNYLLSDLDGREVEVGKEKVILKTAQAVVNSIRMTPIEGFLHAITDPNIAVILMTLGMNGLIFELMNPGGHLPGVVGAICILLALFGMGVLGVNYTGLLFIVLAFILFVADVKTPTHGLLTAGGILSFILGSLILFNSPFAPVSKGLVVGIGLTTGAFFAFIIAKALQAQKRRATTGREGIVGVAGVAKSNLDPQGSVFVEGEWWDAEALGGAVKAGEQVRVVRKEGKKLFVEKAN